LTDRRDFSHDWLLERKFDGERCIARKLGRNVPAVSERTVCAALAVRNRPSRALPTFTHIAARRSHICEMLKLAAALDASGMASDPLIDKGLATDVDSQLGPRSKLGGEDHTMHRVGRDRPECEAIVTNLRNL